MMDNNSNLEIDSNLWFLYLFFYDRNPFESVNLLSDFEKYSLKNCNLISNVKHNNEILIFDVIELKGSCRGFLYPDKKFIGKIKLVDKSSTIELNGTYDNYTKGKLIKGDAVRSGDIKQRFVIEAVIKKKFF